MHSSLTIEFLRSFVYKSWENLIKVRSLVIIKFNDKAQTNQHEHFLSVKNLAPCHEGISSAWADWLGVCVFLLPDSRHSVYRHVVPSIWYLRSHPGQHDHHQKGKLNYFARNSCKILKLNTFVEEEVIGRRSAISRRGRNCQRIAETQGNRGRLRWE